MNYEPSKSTGFRTLVSSVDESVNWLYRSKRGGQFECRFVFRHPSKAVIYLSAQDGCSQACRMCHLTATGQKRFGNATFFDVMNQAQAVLDWIRQNDISFDRLHYNFMARGEPLDNSELISQWDSVADWLVTQAKMQIHSREPKILVSTIIPKNIGHEEFECLSRSNDTHIYYSLYSLNPAFRRKWLPNAMRPVGAFDLLQAWQRRTGKRVRVHFCFIKGENDSLEDAASLCRMIDDYQINVDINIVRYNPYSRKHGEEADNNIIFRNLEFLRTHLPSASVKLIPRVGFDVYASCGMFAGRSDNV